MLANETGVCRGFSKGCLPVRCRLMAEMQGQNRYVRQQRGGIYNNVWEDFCGICGQKGVGRGGVWG